MTTLVKWLPSLIPVLLVLLNSFSTPIGAFIAAHPTVALVVAALASIFNHLSPQPQKPAL